jgi:hypothetical protein
VLYKEKYPYMLGFEHPPLKLPYVHHGSQTVLRGSDLVLSSAGGSWFGAGGIVYFCPELLLIMAILKYIVSE